MVSPGNIAATDPISELMGPFTGSLASADSSGWSWDFSFLNHSASVIMQARFEIDNKFGKLEWEL